MPALKEPLDPHYNHRQRREEQTHLSQAQLEASAESEDRQAWLKTAPHSHP